MCVVPHRAVSFKRHRMQMTPSSTRPSDIHDQRRAGGQQVLIKSLWDVRSHLQPLDQKTYRPDTRTPGRWDAGAAGREGVTTKDSEGV